MRQRVWLVLFFAVANCSSTKDPKQAAKDHTVQISNGFAGRGGVLLNKDHVLGEVSLVPSTGDAQILHAGKAYNAGLVKREEQFGVLLLHAVKLKGANLGDSGALATGDALFLQCPMEDGSVSEGVEVLLTGWRPHKGLAHMEIAYELPKNCEGTGVFSKDGHLVGLVAFSLGNKQTYVLPIEYLTTGAKALTTQVLGKREPSAAFIKQRDEAATKKEALEAPLSFSRVSATTAYSRAALVGSITVLVDPQAADSAVTKPIQYKIEAIDQRRARRTIAEGKIKSSDQKFVVLKERKDEIAAATAAIFGQGYVATNITPYDLVELRYRIAFPIFCPKVTEDEVHAVNLTLADGRKSEEIAFADMVNICAHIEEGEGELLEKQWGFTGGKETASKKPDKKPAGKRKKKGR